MWHEKVPPLVIIEYASGDGSKERDRTPMEGKFWIYEHAIGAKYYAIFEIDNGAVELYRLDDQSNYVQVPPNRAGRLAIPELGVELRVWEGEYSGIEAPWLRVWDATTGEMMPSLEERAESERKRAESERKRADTAESLADDYRESLNEETERAEAARKEAEAARKEAEAARQKADAETRRVEAAQKEAESAKRQRDAEKRQRDAADNRADAATKRANALAEKLRALGIDPEAA